MASLQDYLEGSPLFDTQKEKEYNRLLSNMAGYQGNRAAAQALGLPDLQAQPERGLVSRVLGGVGALGTAIDLPARGVRALLTKGRRGGDIIKTDRDDNIFERGAKLVGAFGIDVATDPLSYIGAPASLGRKFAASVVVDPVQTSRLLGVAEDVISQSGRSADDLVLKLAAQSPEARTAAEQIEAGVEATDKTAAKLFDLSDPTIRRELAGRELGRVLGESLEAGGRSLVTRNLTSLLGDANVAAKVFDELPDVAKGGIYIVNPITGKPHKRIAGGKGRVSKTAEFLNRRRFAAAMGFGEGIYRVTGGKGLAGQMGPAWQDVRRGLKSVISDPTKLVKSNMGRLTLPGYQVLRTGFQKAQSINNKIILDAAVSADSVWNRRNAFDEAEKLEFDSVYTETHHLPSKPLESTSAAAQAAAEEARKGRALINKTRDEAQALGVDISDLGSDYTTLIYSEEYRTKMLEEGVRGSGPRRGDLQYGGIAPRSEWVVDYVKEPNKWAAILKAAGVDETLPIEDAISRIGAQLTDGKVALAPITINKYLRSIGELGAGQIRFVENPQEIIDTYMRSLGRRMSGQSLVNDALRAGVLFADPLTLTRQTRMMSDFIEGMREVAPEVAKRAQAAVDGRRAALVQQAKVGSQEVVEEAKAARDQARARYDVSKRNESAVVKSLREATDEVDRLRKAAGNISPALRQYGREGQEELQVQLVRTNRNVKARLKRAQAALKESKSAQRNAQKRLDRVESKAVTAEDKASQLLFEVETLWDEIVLEGAEPVLRRNYEKLEELLAAADDDVSEILAKERLEESLLDEARSIVLAKTEKVSTARNTITDTAVELDSVRNASAALRGQLSEQQQMVVGQFEQALSRRAEVAQQLEDAVTIRNQFRPDARRLSRRIPLESAQALDVLAGDYATAIKSLDEATNAYKTAKKDGADTTDKKMKLDSARKAVSSSKKALTEAIGSWGGKGSIIAKYRKALVKAAEELAAEDLVMMRIISDNKRLEDLLVEAGSRSGAHLEAATRDLQQMFYDIRSQMTDADYKAFKDASSILQTAPSRSELPLLRNDPAVSKYGEFLNDNSFKAIGSGVEGGSVNVPRYLSDLHGARGVREVLENTYRINADPDSIKGFFNDVYDPLMLLWKGYVTIGRGPSYLLTNTVGGMYMNHTKGISAKIHRETARAMLAFREAMQQAEKELPNATRLTIQQRADELAAEKVAGLTIAGLPAIDILTDYATMGGRDLTQSAEVRRLMSANGLAIDLRDARRKTPNVRAQWKGEPTGKVEAVFRKTVDAGLTNRYMSIMSDGTQSSEAFVRIAAYADGLAKYGSKTTAWDQMVTLHFDYQNLSDAEQKIRRLMPFYTWTRNNVPAQIRALFLQPGKIRRFLYARDAFKNAFGTDEENGWMNDYLPEFVAEVGGFATMFGGDSPIAVMGRLPFDDIERLMTPAVNTQEVIQMLGPWQSAIDMFTGVNSSTGQKFNPQGERAGGYLSLLGYIPKIGKTGRDGERRVDSRVAAAIREFLPQLELADRAVSAASYATGGRLDPLTTERGTEKGLQNLINLSGLAAAGGFSSTQVTPSTMAGELTSRQEKQLAVLVDRAGDMGVSLDWIRKQLRAGVSPQELAIMINSGMGTVAEETMNADEATISDRYYKVMQGVREGRVDLGY